MAQLISRRRALKTSGAAVAGAGVASVVFLQGAAHAAPVVKGKSRVVQVVRHTGDTAEVSVAGNDSMTVPVHGFPVRWQLRKGDLVLLTGPDADAFPSTAMPLLAAIRGRIAHSGRAGKGALGVGGVEVSLRNETIIEAPMINGAGSRGTVYVASVIENALDHTLTCVALRADG